MLKLIASDIDGTLIPYGRSALSDTLFPLLRRLREKGILFCPASGRQYHSLRGLFAPVADEVCFLCANGAVVYGPGKEDSAPILSITALPRADALALAHAIMETPGCDVLIDGANMSYVCDCGDALMLDLNRRVGSLVRRVERVEDVAEEIIKVSAFCPGGTAAPAEWLGPRFGARYHMAAAGPDWLDFGLADKGVGLRAMCLALGVSPEETAAFGDNWNDLPMLDLAGTPWLMDTAPRELLDRFPLHCSSVEQVLTGLLDR